jgi:hypothetical protein
MPIPKLTSQTTLGLISGIMVFAGLRTLGAFIEGICTGYSFSAALLSTGMGIILLPVGIGLLYQSRVSFILAKFYAWIFVLGNSVLIPLYFLHPNSFSITPAATIATWIAMVAILVLIRVMKLSTYINTRPDASPTNGNNDLKDNQSL